MLIEFSVGNYRSFKEPVTLSLVAAPLKSADLDLDRHNLYKASNKLSLLKGTAIYGANASGKSNLIKALHFMQDFMVNSSRDGQSTDLIPVEPFQLSTATVDQPSFFELVFLLDQIQYRYGFEVTPQAVVKEWMYYIPKTRETEIFYRDKDQINAIKRLDAQLLSSKTRKNALFLSVCAQFNVDLAERVIQFIRSSLKIISGLQDHSYMFYTLKQLSEGVYSSKIQNLIRFLDLGFHDIQVHKSTLSLDDLPSDMPDSFKSVLLETLEGKTGLSLHTIHHKYDTNGTLVTSEIFDLDAQESEGTKKMVALAGPLIETLEQGSILLVDELDARLHPLLSQAIIKLFNSAQTNPNHAQLIFTTHDTNLLSHKLWRRDQIWFTEKQENGASDLYSLAEYRGVRSDAAFARDYIQGRYGAIPYLGGLSDFFVSEEK